MKNILLFLLAIVFATSCALKKETVYLFVAKNGEITNDGSEEKPFSSLDDAVKRASEIKARTPDAEISINISKGDYYLSSPIIIPPNLSGLTIKGTDASKVKIKGSKILTGDWQKHTDDIYVMSVSEGLDFDQLVVNDKAQILARYPNYDESSQYWQGYAADAISKERLASWEKPQGAIFNVLHSGRWGGFHYLVSGINKDGTAILEGGHQNNRYSKPHEEFRMVENVFEELDSPGEWYLDASANKLYFWPQKELDLNTADIEVSQLKDLIQIVGTLENPVRDVNISGITFENTKRTFMEDFEPLLRSDWTIYRGSVLFLEGTENCKIENNEFTNLGGNAIMASKYNDGLLIKGNHIHECGASAISFIGDPSAVRSPSFTYKEFVPLAEIDTVAGPQNELYPRNCLVEDNLIYRIGRIEKQTAGVQISMAMDITVKNNSIYDVPRAGINIGDGTWGGHILEFNDVFNTVLETSDHGSFNSWGRDRFWHPNRNIMDSIIAANPTMYEWDAIKTTIIRNNRFRCDHGWDIDLDDGSSNYHIYNNLLLHNGLKLREGLNRVVENNIIVNNSLHPHVWFENSEDVFRHNIISDGYKDIRLSGWGKELDYNLFPNELALMKSQLYDRDEHSIYGDPMFKDPENLDFTVASNSPAIEIGFENFPMHQFGVQKPELKEIAKTPEGIELANTSEVNIENALIVPWLGNELKSVESEQEQSAYGLSKAEGVILVNIRKDSPAVKNDGLKKGDVIIEAAGKKIKTVKDFFQVNLENKTGNLDLTIMRNQSEKNITINTK
ncbi:PDZ domain-containing protein [Arcticibacterium luteifluviistationis]|uniref:Peptide-binding protein n=1 Tax=Arcticibacterium luteifluviistationis TaxID=1784714 RepID=A0A2Z4G8V4_9BACT|nr:PDZ domain-containing protein [Arcticibacterium luteifluviistationis]AWV97647.1 peptide-binding protein [Arcticibacterium luteifluviistationis]